MTDAELVELSHLNFVEGLREHARWNASGVVDERDDTVRVLSATRFAAGFFNAVIPSGAAPADPTAWVAAQSTFYSNHQRGFTVYLRADRDLTVGEACLRAGLRLTASPPGMVCDAPVPELALPNGSSLDEVHDVACFHELTTVLASAYALLGLPESVTHKALGEPERLLKPHLGWFFARVDGEPAAAAMTIASHTAAGIFWLGTRPDMRGRRLGEACARAATNAAFARGARAVFAQASEPGETIYKRIGFREITRYPWYLATRD